MLDESTGNGPKDRNQLEEKIGEGRERDWRRWPVVVLLIGLTGLTLAAYSVIRPAWSLSRPPGPLIYGLIAALVLFKAAEERLIDKTAVPPEEEDTAPPVLH